MEGFKCCKGTALPKVGKLHYNVWATFVVDGIECINEYLQLLGRYFETDIEARAFAESFSAYTSFLDKADAKKLKVKNSKIRIFIEATDGYAKFENKETIKEFAL